MKYLLTSLLALSCGSFAHAQTTISVGPQIGFNASTSHYYLKYDEKYHPTYLSRAAAGLTATASHQHVTVQTALLYSQKGFQFVDERESRFLYRLVQERYTLDYLTLPLNLAYTLREDGQGFQVFAGGYLGYLVKGQHRFNNYYRNLNDNPPERLFQGETKILRGSELKFDGKTYSKALDGGMQAGIGYRYQQLLLQASYSIGLRDVAPEYVDRIGAGKIITPSYKNRVAQVSLAYLFEVRK